MADVDSVAASVASVAVSVNTLWVALSAILVFFMQLGFAMLEAGSVRKKNTSNIIFKNFMDAALAAVVFWIFGFAFAYGVDDENGFIGSSNFALGENADYIGWFFQYAFSATATTIVSGAVAERTKLVAYMVYSIVISGFIYPVVVHWVWDADGWLSAGNDTFGDGHYGMIDFAGSGVVHMVGGVAGLMGAILVGPRIGRFKENRCCARNVPAPELPPAGTIGTDHVHGDPIPGQSKVFVALGTFILWVGWYGFNGGSTLGFTGGAEALGSKVLVTTTLAASAACISSVFLGRAVSGHYSLGIATNGVLAGLVAITAPCATVDPWAAFVIGVLAGLLYVGASATVAKLGIDDPLDAVAVHGVNGFFGVLAVGIFSTDENIAVAYGTLNESYSSGHQFGVQLLAAVVIAAWTAATSGIMFFIVKKTTGLRVPRETELLGLDHLEHGGWAFERGFLTEQQVQTLVEIVAHHLKEQKGAPNSGKLKEAQVSGVSSV